MRSPAGGATRHVEPGWQQECWRRGASLGLSALVRSRSSSGAGRGARPCHAVRAARRPRPLGGAPLGRSHGTGASRAGPSRALMKQTALIGLRCAGGGARVAHREWIEQVCEPAQSRQRRQAGKQWLVRVRSRRVLFLRFGAHSVNALTLGISERSGAAQLSLARKRDLPLCDPAQRTSHNEQRTSEHLFSHFRAQTAASRQKCTPLHAASAVVRPSRSAALPPDEHRTRASRLSLREIQIQICRGLISSASNATSRSVQDRYCSDTDDCDEPSN